MNPLKGLGLLMQVNHLIRDAAVIQKGLRQEANQLIAVNPCQMYIPDLYFNTGLGVDDGDLRVTAIFALVSGNHYSVSRTCAMMPIQPSSTNVVEVNEVRYREYSFEKGDIVCTNLNLVRIATLVYRIFDLFISKGKNFPICTKIPFYLYLL